VALRNRRSSSRGERQTNQDNDEGELAAVLNRFRNDVNSNDHGDRHQDQAIQDASFHPILTARRIDGRAEQQCHDAQNSSHGFRVW